MTTLAQDRHLCRDDLSLQRGYQLLGLFEPQPKLGQTRVLITLDPGHLGLGRHAGLQLGDQLHSPHQFRHPPTLIS
ncbi:MAG: hypothetical protein JOZ17_27925 [Acetobacteraceae bacterium]|nr:hypothetical protein [Acetobacteraceae bacterium]